MPLRGVKARVDDGPDSGQIIQDADLLYKMESDNWNDYYDMLKLTYLTLHYHRRHVRENSLASLS